MYRQNAYEPADEAGETNMLLLARELEWAEAYALDNPDCEMGQLYLDMIRRDFNAEQEDC